jgi:type I restriction-modification system DNA methylase subunit
MELATLFFAFCAEHYLADGGTLAFVMPRSILTGAKQHAKFRQRFVATANLLIDCEKVTPLFNVPACVVLWGKGQGGKGQGTNRPDAENFGRVADPQRFVAASPENPSHRRNNLHATDSAGTKSVF